MRKNQNISSSFIDEMNKDISRKIFQVSLEAKLNQLPKFNNLRSLDIDFGLKNVMLNQQIIIYILYSLDCEFCT